jgi:hypothetical protein
VQYKIPYNSVDAMNGLGYFGEVIYVNNFINIKKGE